MSASSSVRQTPTRLPQLLGLIFGTRSTERPVDLALLFARVGLAWIFIYHGSGKLFGWFNGAGFHRTALYFSSTAHLHPGGLFALVGGVIEFGGGIALAFGIVSRLAGLAIFGDMVMAMITVSWANGINSETPTPGYELNLALGVLALVVGLIGAGRLSLDAVIASRLRVPSPSSGPSSTRSDRRAR